MRVLNKKYIVISSLSLLLFSCAKLDEEVESGVKIEKPVSVVIDETVSDYDVLKSYSGDLLIGTNVSYDEMSGSGAKTTLLMTNFEQITPETALHSDVMMSDEGDIDFTDIESYIDRAEELGLSVYGDAIVSNLNQNDTYLKTIGTSLTFLTPLYPNFVKPGVLEDGTFNGWTVNGDVSVEEYMGQPSVKMVNGASVSSGDATSLQSPVYSVDEDAKFEMTFYLLSTEVGEGRVTFTGLNTNEPEMDWMGTGSESSTFTTKIGWNEIQVQTSDFDGSGSFSFNIELGYTSDVTYYMNIQGLSLINLNGSVENPDEIFLECEDAQQIGQWMIPVESDEASGGVYLNGIIDGNSANMHLGTGTPADADNQDYQFTYTFNVNTTGIYSLWVRQRAEYPWGGDDSFFMSVDGADYYCPGWPAWGDDTNTQTWTWFKLYTGAGNQFNLDAGEHSVSLKIREGAHFFDKLYLTMTSNTPSGFGSAVISQEEVTLEISDDVKIKAIEKVLNDYVASVLTNVGDKISDWTVVSNPFAEDGSVAVSSGSSVEGTFYWADYIGGDYIEQAFTTAKANAASGAKLFISETGLNTNAAKLSAVISSVSNILEIDGIAVSLDLNTDTDLDAVGDMLDDLAATGKLVYITNLSVSVTELSEESYALQSEVYKAVLNLYKSKIPVSQQYGISLSEPVSNWLGLWDSNYNRKQGYAGFVVGLGAQE